MHLLLQLTHSFQNSQLNVHILRHICQANLMHEIRKRETLRKKAEKTNCSELWERFRNLRRKIKSEMETVTVSVEEVFHLLSGLCNTKAPGPDGISARLLRVC